MCGMKEFKIEHIISAVTGIAVAKMKYSDITAVHGHMIGLDFSADWALQAKDILKPEFYRQFPWLEEYNREFWVTAYKKDNAVLALKTIKEKYGERLMITPLTGEVRDIYLQRLKDARGDWFARLAEEKNLDLIDSNNTEEPKWKIYGAR